jgi:hypothetical protein
MFTGRSILVIACILSMFASAAQAARPVTLMRDAQEAYLGGRFDDALKLYEQASDESDRDLSVLYNAALCRISLGRIDEAVQTFENVAAKANVNVKLRADALFNIGVVRASHARGQLAPPTQTSTRPTATQPTPIELSVEDLESIAAELLVAIDFFGQARRAGADADDVEHNIRAARATRREVLGLIRQAREAAEKKREQEALEDPQAYLTALIAEQRVLMSISRRLDRHPAESMSQQRRRRRIALRMQRDILQRTDTLAGHLEQFTETADDKSATTQPATESPREQLYHEAARRLESALDHQRAAAAYLLEGQLDAVYQQQRQAVDALREVERLFPLDPVKALARWHGEQQQLAQIVSGYEHPGDWQVDPMLPPTERDPAASQPTTQPDTLSVTVAPEDIPIHDSQTQIGLGLARLAVQAQTIAAHTPETPTSAPATEPDPRTDPELNRRLAEVLAKAEAPHTRCLTAIAELNRDATASAQEELSGIIRQALDLFPKSLEERLQLLIARQEQLNAETTAAADPEDDAADEDGSAWQSLGRTMLGKMKTLLSSPSAAAKALAEQQTRIQTDTRQVEGDIKQQATTMAGGQDGAQNPRVQALIEAGRHVGEADRQMLSAIEELQAAAVASSLTKLEPEGPVPTAQTAATEALVRALTALNPPQDEQQQDQDEQQQDSEQQQEQQPQPRQDIRRAMEQLDQEREQAERQLYRDRPSSTGKNW